MNELKIEIPKGMEIDLEKSILTGNEPAIRFKEIGIKYEDIENKNYGLGNYVIYASAKSQLDKIVAINKLMNIAAYYNAKSRKVIDWENSNQYKYRIYFNKCNYDIDNNTFYNFGSVYFLNRGDAQSVIDNPNFREILDIIFKNQ